MPAEPARRVLMLGTFGLRPKATLRARALAMAHVLLDQQWTFRLVTTPWDYPSDAGKRWCEHGVPIVNTRSVRPIAFPRATLQTVRESRDLQPDLVHLFKPKGFGDVSARWLSRDLPIVVDMDDWEGDGGWNEIGGYNWLQRRIFDWQETSWPRKASAVTVASRALERRAIDLGAHPEHVHYVPNGLTRARFDQLASGDRASRDMTDRPPAILLYTRFVEFQPEFVVRVLHEVRRALPSATLHIAGASADGHAEAALRQGAQAAGIADVIRWHGWIGPDELPLLASACDVAIHPFDDNLVNRSKCSVKLLELMATGIPVVTTEVGENTAFIEDGVSGVLTPAGDAGAMAHVVVDLLKRRQPAEQLGRSAQARVKARFLWEELAPRVAAAYEQALNRR